MKQTILLCCGASLAALGMAAYAAPAAKSPPPIATYWMDAATQSGLGAGMTAGARPDIGQIMNMMSGGSSVARTLELRLASKQKPAAAPQADHWVPAGLAMGPSLPLVTPTATPAARTTPGLPSGFQQPKGRMLIYWGCAERVGAGQPTIVDFSKMAAGKVPPGLAAMSGMARAVTAPTGAPGFGRWPNDRDSRAVPAAGSLAGAHRVEGNYSPPIAFSLAAGQDFMPGLGLAEAGALPSGASRLRWRLAPTATGYALAMFGAAPNGDVIMWSSAKSAAMPTLDYLAPAEVKRLAGTGAVLPPSASECVLPAEVAAASPAGMVTMIGYGPEVHFAEQPKAPKWTAKVRFKTGANLVRGMGDMGGVSAGPAQPVQRGQQPRKRKRFGLGDVLKGALPPIP